MFRRWLWLLLYLAGCERLFPREPLTACPASYAPLLTGSSTYRFVAQPAAWVDAEQQCEADSDSDVTHLAVPDDVAEYMRLQDRVVALDLVAPVWLGVGRDFGVAGDDPASFRGINDQSVPAALWELTEPDNTNNIELTATLQQPARMADRNPGEPFPFICECDGLAPVPFDFQ